MKSLYFAAKTNESKKLSYHACSKWVTILAHMNDKLHKSNKLGEINERPYAFTVIIEIQPLDTGNESLNVRRVVLWIVLFYVLFCVDCVVLCTVCVSMYTVLLPPGVYPIAVKYIISYQYQHRMTSLNKRNINAYFFIVFNTLTLILIFYKQQHYITMSKVLITHLKCIRVTSFICTG